MSDWTFLTNHARVLLCIAEDRDMRVRDVADRIGITERAAQRIIRDLEDAGYITRRRDGRRNRYELKPDRPFRHPLQSDHQIGELLALLTDESAPAAGPASGRAKLAARS